MLGVGMQREGHKEAQMIIQTLSRIIQVPTLEEQLDLAWDENYLNPRFANRRCLLHVYKVNEYMGF